jgi:hypothetical protein
MALSKNHLIAVALVVAILLAVGNIIRTCEPEQRELDVANRGGLGGIGAKHIHEFLGPDKRIALIFFDASAATIYGKDQRILEGQLELFGHKIVGKKEIPAGPLFSNPDAAYTGILPMAEYGEFVAEHPRADAIVSFVGPPVVPEDEELPGASGPPLLIANAIGHQATWDLLKSGFVSMAILPRQENEEDPDEVEDPGSGPVDPFEDYYTVYTPETAGDF